MKFALGLVETRGLVGSIEAADVMVKTADVRLLGLEITPEALVTVQITGDTASVQAAVEAGAAAASRVGMLISSIVIPRPDDELDVLFPATSNGPAPAPAHPAPPAPRAHRKPEPPAPTPSMPAGDDADLLGMSVPDLRTLARQTDGLGIQGREISRANKDILVAELLKVRRAHTGEI